MLEDKLIRWSKFWHVQETDRPLFGFWRGWFPLKGSALLQTAEPDREVTPDDLNPKELLPEYESRLKYASEIEDDTIPVVQPLLGFPWLEAVMGCKIYFGSETVWVKEQIADWSGIEKIPDRLNDANPWLCKYLEFATVLSDHFGDSCAVGQGVLRGPSDIMAVLRGSSGHILDIYDHPAKLKCLGEMVVHTYKLIVKALFDAVPPFRNGRALGQFSLWAPGECIQFGEDAADLYSPGLYETMLKPIDSVLASYVEYSLIHWHSTSSFLLPQLVTIPDLKVVQITRDANDTDIERLTQSAAFVQNSGKAVQLRGQFSIRELENLRKTLHPEGLYIQCVYEHQEQVKELSQIVYNR